MISIIIPTMQKRIDILKNLVKTLNDDNSVGEIIIINNAIKPLEFSYDKMRIITPDDNIYVNPAWNLGIKEAKYDTVGILNDDIIIADNFCTSLLAAFPENAGVLGYSSKAVIPINNTIKKPENAEIKLHPIDFIDFGFGIAIFLHKASYPVIPEELKIMYGDCYIFDELKKNGYQNYTIEGQKILHFGSLTSSSKNLSPIIKKDKCTYKKLTTKWYENIFSIKEYTNCVKMRFLGVNLRLCNKK